MDKIYWQVLVGFRIASKVEADGGGLELLLTSKTKKRKMLFLLCLVFCRQCNLGKYAGAAVCILNIVFLIKGCSCRFNLMNVSSISCIA